MNALNLIFPSRRKNASVFIAEGRAVIAIAKGDDPSKHKEAFRKANHERRICGYSNY